MKRLIFKRQSGFTIIEVIVAISIIIILTSLTVGRFNLFSDQQDLQKEGQNLASCIQKAQSYARDPSGNGLSQTPRYVEARIERVGDQNQGFRTRCYMYIYKSDTKYADINQIDVLSENNPNVGYLANLMIPLNSFAPLYDSEKMNLSGADLRSEDGKTCKVTGLVVSGIRVSGDGFSANDENNCGKSWKPSDLGLYSSSQAEDQFRAGEYYSERTLAHLNLKSANTPSVIRLIFGNLEGGAPIALKCTSGCDERINPIMTSDGGQIPFGDGFSTYIFVDNADNLLNTGGTDLDSEQVKDYAKSITNQGVIKIPAYGYPITYENIND